ncbi:hypothetical protein TSAR_009486 [Trichomalopsis sarcophagae]|uniref:Uncharacterized protein n=1 Tax=Trichomalopsis sarcophagae TaxID=543379 RepID=A0A232F6U6_9HYME|nr:hypothetical protein TSAR_009486 [Trichomalopsis sarcophagae]
MDRVASGFLAVLQSLHINTGENNPWANISPGSVEGSSKESDSGLADPDPGRTGSMTAINSTRRRRRVASMNNPSYISCSFGSIFNFGVIRNIHRVRPIRSEPYVYPHRGVYTGAHINDNSTGQQTSRARIQSINSASPNRAAEYNAQMLGFTVTHTHTQA